MSLCFLVMKISELLSFVYVSYEKCNNNNNKILCSIIIINLLDAFTISNNQGKGREIDQLNMRWFMFREEHRLCMFKIIQKKRKRRWWWGGKKVHREKFLYSVFIELVSLYLVAIQHISIVSFLHKYTLPCECWMPCANWKFYRSHKTHKKYKTHV